MKWLVISWVIIAGIAIGVRQLIPPHVFWDEGHDIISASVIPISTDAVSTNLPSKNDIRRAKRLYRKTFNFCAACGSARSSNGNRIDIHHIFPVSENPEKAAIQSNLISMCRKHHYTIGHCSNWNWHNTNVEATAAAVFRVISETSSCTRGNH